MVSISAVFILHAARSTQVIAIWIHTNQKERATKIKNLDHKLITNSSHGTKNHTKNFANKNTITHIIVKNVNEIFILVFATSCAKSVFFAHIFCHTRAETAIDNHIATIIIICITFDHAQ